MGHEDEGIKGIDEGITWADPAIRTEYEAALGRFMLAYNEADYLLSVVIAAELSKRGPPELARLPQRAISRSG